MLRWMQRTFVTPTAQQAGGILYAHARINPALWFRALPHEIKKGFLPARSPMRVVQNEPTRRRSGAPGSACVDRIRREAAPRPWLGRPDVTVAFQRRLLAIVALV